MPIDSHEPEAHEPEVHELDAFRRAVLESELSRVTWMLGVFVLFALLGLYRAARPSEGGAGVGPIVLAISGAYLLLEVMARAYLKRRRADGQPVSAALARTHSTLECLFPVLAAGCVLVATDLSPYTVLVSPAYGFILVLLSLSVLRLDVIEAVVTGVLGASGFGALVVFVFLTNDVPATSPHPPLLYVNLTIVLLIATGVVAFITRRVRRYVMTSVREAETRRQRDLLQRDLEVAGAIQRGLLPSSVPSLEGYDIAAVSEPADQAGGDYFDWEMHGEDRCVISLADVTGHGVGPALVTAACRAYVRATTSSHTDPLTLLERVNALVHADSTGGRFVTFALLDLDPRTHRGRFLSCGHAPTLYLRHDAAHPETIGAQGLPLGIVPESELEAAITLELEHGDVLVLFSDGFYEWKNEAGEQFGLERLAASICSARDEDAGTLLERLRADVREFAGATAQPDDMTAIVIKRA